jgi:hypothetical protein
VPQVRRIGIDDLRWALTHGFQDFAASRTDVIFLCVVYPLLGLLLARVASGYDMLPLVFPLVSGFALVGPLAAVGLNEMSRRREQGMPAGLGAAFGAFRSPSIGSIVLLGVVLMMLLVSWMVFSNTIYNATLGPQPPESLSSFVNDVLYTHAGRMMMLVGIGSGFVFAVVALTLSAVTFPMLLDRNAQSGDDGRVGSDHRRQPCHRFNPSVAWPGDRNAGSGTRDLALVPPRGPALAEHPPHAPALAGHVGSYSYADRCGRLFGHAPGSVHSRIAWEQGLLGSDGFQVVERTIEITG